MKLLIVDDSNMIRTRIASLMRDARLSDIDVVGLARDGKAALRLAIQEKPDMMTLDLTMPEMDGIAAVKEIKQMDSAAKVVMVSAMGQQAMVIEAIRSGAADFIVKPFQPDRVLEALSKALS